MNATPRTLLKRSTAQSIPNGTVLSGERPPPKVGFMSPKTAIKNLTKESPAGQNPLGVNSREPTVESAAGPPPLSPKPLNYRPEPKRSSLFGGFIDTCFFLVEHLLLTLNTFLAFSIITSLIIVGLRFNGTLL